MSILGSCSRYRDRDIRRKLRGQRGIDRRSSSNESRHVWGDVRPTRKSGVNLMVVFREEIGVAWFITMVRP